MNLHLGDFESGVLKFYFDHFRSLFAYSKFIDYAGFIQHKYNHRFILFLALYRQVWFIILMVFAIGCTGVSAAASKVMHEQMDRVADHQMLKHGLSNTELNTTQPDITQSATHQMSLNCQQMMDHDSSTASLEKSNLEKSKKSQATQNTQHQHCSDCSPSVCQAMFAWLNTDHIHVLPALITDQNQAFIHAYQAQYLLGYWSEILRPPKI